MSIPRSWSGLIVLFAVLTAPATSISCSSQTTAKSYTVAKVDRSGRLVPIDVLPRDREVGDDHTKDTAPKDSGTNETATIPASHPAVEASVARAAPDADRLDALIESPECLEIRLSDHFVRFLNALGAPELVIFTRCRIRAADGSQPEVVYDRVLMNTEDQELTQAGLQGAGGSLRDVVVLPSIEYSNEDILLSIRVLELDQGDNQRIGKLLQAASAASAQLKTASAPELSAFQAVVSFLVANNPDDVEFALDLGLSANASTTFTSNADGLPSPHSTKTHTITPRIGMLAAIKTEGVDRLVIPQKYEQYLPQVLTWTIANVARLVTLDLFNALPGRIDYDAYSDFFGDPLRVPSNTLVEPAFANGTLQHRMNIDDLDSPESRREFFVTDRSLCTRAPTGENSVPEPFRDKSYVLLSVQSPSKGVAVKELANLSDSLEKLKLRTTQLTGAELQKLLEQIKADVQTRAAKNEARTERDRKERDTRREDPRNPRPESESSSADKSGSPSKRLRKELEELNIEPREVDRRVREVEAIERG